MRASRILSLSLVIAATVATAGVTQAQTRRPRPAPAPAAAAPAHTAVAEPIPPVAQAPGDAAPNAPGLLSRESEIRRGLGFQAFVDAKYSLPSEVGATGRGFSLNDAALYLSKDFGSGLAAMIDLPFGADGASNDVAFGQNKAQAFLQYNRGILNAKIGQFDTIFGAEQNDSKDRFFTDAGLAKSTVVPVTHTGVVVGAGFGNFVLRGLIADPQNTATMTNENAEFGLQGRFDMAPVYVSVGALYGQDHNVATERNNLLLDVMAGFRAEQFRLDAFFNSNDTSATADDATVFGAIGTFNMNEALDLGARLEFGKDLQTTFLGTAGQYDAMTLTVGPSYKWMPDVTLRGDVSYSNVEPSAGGSDENVYGLNLSIVANL